MRFRDFWRGGHEREREERDREQERRMANQSEQNARDYELQDQDFERRGWRPGSDYYGNDPERFGAGSVSGEQSDESENRREFDDRWEESYGRDSLQSYPLAGYLGIAEEHYVGPYGSQGYSGSVWLNESDLRPDDTGYWGQQNERDAGAMRGSGPGQFRGLGPRGYRRSDDRIREDVCECLTEDAHIDASNVDVAVIDCTVTLTGTVNSRAEKRRAEDLIESLSGIKDINNNLRVAG